MTIKTKADLAKFIKSAKATNAAQTKILDEMKALLKSVASKHGRSNEAREAVVAAAKLNTAFGNARDASAKAPKKGASSKGSSRKSSPATRKLTDTEKEARAAERAKVTEARRAEKAAAQYGDEAAVSGKHLCLCGCGAETEAIELKNGDTRHKLFIQGHDAKLKGKVKFVAKGYLPKRVLSPYAQQWISRWYVITDEERAACDIKTLPKKWEEMTENNKRPSSWEEFDALRS
jgi:hypothetical protein